MPTSMLTSMLTSSALVPWLNESAVLGAYQIFGLVVEVDVVSVP